MAMPHASNAWTVERLDALPDDGQRYEIIDGELFVTPAPAYVHQYAIAGIFKRLDAYLAGTGIGRAAFAPIDVTFSRATRVQPDVVVLPLVDGRAPLSWEEAGRLLLVVEVRSPATAKRDRGRKRELYQRQGVPEYWLVDTDAETIERWRPGSDRPELCTERITWRPDGAATALSIDLAEFFHSLTTP